MAEDSGLERTEDATPKRQQQARTEGQVPRSKELGTFAITMTAVAMLIAYGNSLYQQMRLVLSKALTFDQPTLAEPDIMTRRLHDLGLDALIAIMPIFGALMIVAVVAPLLMGGWNLSWQALEPKFSQMNPFRGSKRMFSPNSLVEGGKAILKSMLIGGVATWVIWNERAEIIGLVKLSMDQSLTRTIELTQHTLLIVAGALVLLVVVDVPFQIWQYHKNLRMTKEEVKQEMKESEGSPEVKGRIRQLQREAARRRMMSEIPNASVVVTNPTHYAVALQYADGMRAPRILAKGTLKLAEKIIEQAREHNITIMRAPPFARALYHHAEIGDEIPSALYTAAAQVLAYVFQLKNYQSNGGIAPLYPESLPVPTELDPESKKKANEAPADTSPHEEPRA